MHMPHTEIATFVIVIDNDVHSLNVFLGKVNNKKSKKYRTNVSTELEPSTSGYQR